jgi:hypothetical protein
MLFFVALAESLENLFKLARLSFWNPLLAQVDAEVTGSGTMEADDVGSGESHETFHKIR